MSSLYVLIFCGFVYWLICCTWLCLFLIGKREAEELIEKKVVSAKKQKVEEKKVESKNDKKVLKKKVESSSEDDSSSESEELPKVCPFSLLKCIKIDFYFWSISFLCCIFWDTYTLCSTSYIVSSLSFQLTFGDC